MDGLVSQPQNAVAGLGVLFRRVPPGEKSVIGVEGSVQQVLPVKLLKYQRVQQQRSGLGIAWMRLMNALKSLHSAGIVQVVEVYVRLAHQRISVQRIGMRIRGPAQASRQKQYKSASAGAHPARNALQSHFPSLLTEYASGYRVFSAFPAATRSQ